MDAEEQKKLRKKVAVLVPTVFFVLGRHARLLGGVGLYRSSFHSPCQGVARSGAAGVGRSRQARGIILPQDTRKTAGWCERNSRKRVEMNMTERLRP